MSSNRRIQPVFIMALVVLLTVLVACESGVSEGRTINIVSGSENRTLEPIITQWAESNGYQVNMTYIGSLDIARLLRSGNVQYDAVWPANRLWLDYGDTRNISKHDESIIRSPVVFGVKRSIAERLDWIGQDLRMDDILQATESGRIRFMMTSATQSNSGASFYFAALSAFADSPDVISDADLNADTVQDQISRILGTVDRSSGSSGFLKDLFLTEYNRYDAMVNYEALIIEANQELEQTGREPLYAIYPVDGLAIADSPLAFIDKGIEGKEDSFLALQQFLLSDDAQRQLLQAGRRTGSLGINLSEYDSTIFRADWGIDVNRIIQPIRFPNSDVIENALNLYQTTFRRPSCTAYVLDFSGSMDGNGERDLKAAMRTLLDENLSSQYLLQGHPGDVSTVILFNDGVINGNELDVWTVRGNDPEDLRNLYLRIESVGAGGGTNIFGSAQAATELINNIRTSECLPAVILMTDGQDNGGLYGSLNAYINTTENDVPIFAITFGNAEREQLEPMTNLTYGRIFNGTENLIDAFRSAKGYN